MFMFVTPKARTTQQPYAAAIARCSGPLEQAKAAVAPLELCVTVLRPAAVKFVVTGLDALEQPLLSVSYATPASVKAAQQSIATVLSPSIIAAAEKHDKWADDCSSAADLRHVAALNMDFKEVAIATLLKLPDALPTFSVASVNEGANAGAGGGGAGAGELAPWEAGDALGAPTTLSATVLDQWDQLVAVHLTVTATCYVSAAARADPCSYWLRVETVYPELARVMLFWLTCPPGSCGLERDFSSVTALGGSTRRRCLQFPAFRVAALAQIHKASLNELLAKSC